MDSEQRWIRKIKRNLKDPAANQLVTKYYKEMYAYVYKQTLDVELSLDLTQEIFISVLRSIKGYDSSRASFRTWIYKLASNRLIDYYRSKQYKSAKFLDSLEDYEVDDGQDMTVSLEYKEDFEKVTTIVNELDASTQQIVRLKLFGERTFQEIAVIEGIPEATVKTRYYAALKRIRQRMKVIHRD